MKKAQTKSKMKKPSVNVKASRIAPLKGDEMTHAQTISQSRKLTLAEIAECGGDLAKEEIQLDQVRKYPPRLKICLSDQRNSMEMPKLVTGAQRRPKNAVCCEALSNGGRFSSAR